MPKNNNVDNKVKEVKRKKSTQVPYQFYGYSLQQTVFLLRLLSNEECETISLEVIDDIGTELKDRKKAIQVKSAQKHNPISNHAVDLWKTFSNWVDSINSGSLKLEDTSFEIYCSRPKDGDIASKFSEASDKKTANEAYEYAKKVMIKEDAELSEGLAPYIDNVFKSDKNIVNELICKFKLVCCESIPQEELYKTLKDKLLTEDIIEDVANWAAGWVKNNIDALLEKDKTPCLNKSLFISQLIAYNKKLNTNSILMSCAKEPNVDEVQKEFKRFKTYVKQLDIIDSTDEDKFHAISDYLRASADRTMWGTKGIVHDTSFDEFENGLQRFWKNTKKAVLIESKQFTPEEKGQLIYIRCQSHDLKLQSMIVPEYFIPGSYHALSEDKTIGWHPDYENKLAELAGKGDK